MCYFCFDVLYCHLYDLHPPQVLTLLGRGGGGNIAPLIFKRLSSKNHYYLSHWSITFWQLLNMYILWLQTKKIDICTLTGLLGGVSNSPVKLFCAYFGHIYIFLSIIHILSYWCLNILNFGHWYNFWGKKKNLNTDFCLISYEIFWPCFTSHFITRTQVSIYNKSYFI